MSKKILFRNRKYIERIYSRMEYLAARDDRCYWIDNNDTPEDAVKQILDVIAKKNK